MRPKTIPISVGIVLVLICGLVTYLSFAGPTMRMSEVQEDPWFREHYAPGLPEDAEVRWVQWHMEAPADSMFNFGPTGFHYEAVAVLPKDRDPHSVTNDWEYAPVDGMSFLAISELGVEQVTSVAIEQSEILAERYFGASIRGEVWLVRLVSGEDALYLVTGSR